MFWDRNNIVSIWILGCQREEPELSTENGAFARFCSGNGKIEVHAQGDRAFVEGVLDGLVVSDVEPAYPLDRYAIVP